MDFLTHQRNFCKITLPWENLQKLIGDPNDFYINSTNLRVISSWKINENFILRGDFYASIPIDNTLVFVIVKMYTIGDRGIGFAILSKNPDIFFHLLRSFTGCELSTKKEPDNLIESCYEAIYKNWRNLESAVDDLPRALVNDLKFNFIPYLTLEEILKIALETYHRRASQLEEETNTFFGDHLTIRSMSINR